MKKCQSQWPIQVGGDFHWQLATFYNHGQEGCKSTWFAAGNLRLSLPQFTHFPPKVDSSDLRVAGFLAPYQCSMRTLQHHTFLIYF